MAAEWVGAQCPVRNADIETISILCLFTCRFRLDSGPEIDMLATLDVESTSFRCRRISLSHRACGSDGR